tara:strand:- start:3633 stop:3746 length:114 start_codon:yes stop_codon:yes gene_type:complete
MLKYFRKKYYRLKGYFYLYFARRFKKIDKEDDFIYED